MNHPGGPAYWAGLAIGYIAGAFAVLAVAKLIFALLLGDHPEEWYTPDQLIVHTITAVVTGLLMLWSQRCHKVNGYALCAHCGKPIHGGGSVWLHANGLRLCNYELGGGNTVAEPKE